MLKRQRTRRSGRRPIEEEEEEISPPLVNLPPTPIWAILFIAAVPLLAILICGSRSPVAIGLSAITASACILAIAPRCRVPFLVAIPLGISLIFLLGGFLPASFGGIPPWRASLQKAYEISFPSTHSPQPWISLQGWLMLAVGIFWLLWTLSRGFDEKDRRQILQIFCLAIAAIATFALLTRQNGYTPMLWKGEHAVTYFGPFTNRNNFAGLLAPGAVMAFACTYDAVTRKRRTWILFALSLLPMFAAILTNNSRMGVVFFFVGLGAWVLSGKFATRSAKRFAISASFLLFLAVAFLIFGRKIIERFTGTEGLISTLSADGRLDIFKQSFELLLQSPWLGVGLGNFEPVYALHETYSGQGLITRALHPENDWLWFAIEGGVLAVVAVLIAAFFIWRNFGTWRKSDGSGRLDRRLRAAAGISVALLLAQGLVDTPLHTLGLTTFGALLAGLAWHPTKRKLGGLSTNTLRYAGSAFCFVCGSLWLLVGLGDPVLPGTFTAREQLTKAKTLSAQSNQAEALTAINNVIRVRPMQWNAYFMRAVIRLQLGEPHQAAMDDFARARALEPNHPSLCMQEAMIWLDYAPTFSLPALREAIRRDSRQATSYYSQLVGQIYRFPELREPLRSMGEDPKLRLVYLESASGEDFQVALRQLLDSHPSLGNFTAGQKLKLFELWYNRGERDVLIRELDDNPSWRTDGWIVLARHWAGLGRFKEACDLAFKQMRVPALPQPPGSSDLGQLNRGFLQNPSDPLRGLALYQAQRKEGLQTESITTLRDVCRIPKSPVGALYEYSLRMAERGDYSRSWEAILAYRNRLTES